MSATTQTDHRLPGQSADWTVLVREKLEGLKFGVIQLVVHEGRIIQIERTEKTRLIAPRERAD